MYYNKTMSETNPELNPDIVEEDPSLYLHDLNDIDPNGAGTVCCNGCTCGTSHSSVPRP